MGHTATMAKRQATQKYGLGNPSTEPEYHCYELDDRRLKVVVDVVPVLLWGYTAADAVSDR